MNSPTRRTRPILVVENDPNTIRSFSNFFRGFPLSFASSVSSALEELHLSPIHIIIANENIPQGDGIALLETARHYLPQVIRVLMGNEKPPLLPQMMWAGIIDHFLQKPLSPTSCSKLLDIIHYQPYNSRQSERNRMKKISVYGPH